MVSGVNTFAKGETTRLDWFRPAVRPGFSDSFGVYNSRWQDYMTWNVQDWSSCSDGMRLGGFLPWGETPTHLQVFQGDDADPRRTSTAPTCSGRRCRRATVPTGSSWTPRGPASVFRLSTRTHTQWRFMSDTVAGDTSSRSR